MKNKSSAVFIVCSILMIFGLALPARAQASESDIARIYRGLYESFGGGALEDVMPDGASTLLEEVPDSGSISNALSLRSIVNVLSGGVYKIVGSVLADFAKVMLIVLIFILAEALREGVGAKFAETSLNLTAVLSVSIAVYSVMEDAIRMCTEAISDAVSLLDVAIPVIAAAGAASGKMVSSMVLPGGIAVVIGLFGKLNAYLLLPVMSVYFALSLASSLMPDGALSGICKAIKETVVFAMGLFTTVAAGLLSLQKIVAGASETVVTGAAKFTLGSVIPIVGGIITDAFETVVGCVDVIRAAVGVAGVVGLMILLGPPIIRVLLYSLLFKFASATAALSGEGGVPTFLSAVSDVWGILAAVTICQCIYLITATAIMAG
ncbi:MAG TPA: hypothetical protein VN369_00315 [Terriglobales bacterium]|nr:hypothetical protein [Terriglobales bacterium]